ncbi:hydrogenase maturation protease [Cupriavidus sp. TMH.W2]|uniref:hydrogenase maturation protease n=1 Tax=Cupriavidus sp. TMH.W2 TaxID=3434465 RepID=UPI003D783A16
MSGILVAGIGNVFLGDDGFGVEVVQRLGARQAAHALPPFPEGVVVADFGIRGIDLCYALLDGVDAAILVDATQRGGAPGSLYVIELPMDAQDGDGAGDPYASPVLMSPHEMNPALVLRALRMMGGTCADVVVIGCEPADFGLGEGEEGRIGLSEPVAAAVDRAVAMIEAMVGRKAGQLYGRPA